MKNKPNNLIKWADSFVKEIEDSLTSDPIQAAFNATPFMLALSRPQRKNDDLGRGTPRTDAVAQAASSGPWAYVVDADFARQLERELEAAEEVRHRLLDALLDIAQGDD